MFQKFVSRVVIIFCFSGFANAYDFNEHREIGDRAFNEAFQMIIKHGYFKDSAALAGFLQDKLDLFYYEPDSTWMFDELSNLPNYVSYGVLCGISGDHEHDPLSIKDNLTYKESVLNKILALQNYAKTEFSTGAEDGDLLGVDFRYGLFAALDMSHFYDYGLSLSGHIDEFHKNSVTLLKKPKNIRRVFDELMDVNSIVKYLTIHSFAVHLGQMGGSSLKNGDSAKAYTYLFYALIFNAYGDHFLEDMFAAGHMVVNRSLVGGLINNKALHDFYNKLGLRVMNLKGEIWTTHGDRTLNIPDQEWLKDKDYSEIKNIYITGKFQRIINAVAQSLVDVWAAFSKSKDDGLVDFISSIPDDDIDIRVKERFFLNKFRALYMIPVPFGSNLIKYDLKHEKLPRLMFVNKLLEQRNFVRSRVANSLIFTFRIGDSRYGFERFDKDAFLYLGGRFNFSSKYYIYHNVLDKTGTVDHWFGFTLSMLAGMRFDDKSTLWQYKGGTVYTADVWVSRKRYFSPFLYLEAGIDRRDKSFRLMFAPSVGLQLGPLLGIDNFSLPDWLRIPASIILPFKPVLSYEIISGLKPETKFMGEIDIVF